MSVNLDNLQACTFNSSSAVKTLELLTKCQRVGLSFKWPDKNYRNIVGNILYLKSMDTGVLERKSIIL